MAVGSFVWDVWLGSEYVWNLFLSSYSSIIFLLLYLFIHLLFYSLTSVCVLRVYILATCRYYSMCKHVLSFLFKKFVYVDFCKSIF